MATSNLPNDMPIGVPQCPECGATEVEASGSSGMKCGRCGAVNSYKDW